MKSVLKVRKEFPSTADVEERKKLAKEEFDSWNEYIQFRKSNLNEDYTINEKEFAKVKENFDRFKDRRSLKIKSD